MAGCSRHARGWVRPVYVPGGTNSLDASGAIGAPACGGWSFGTGLDGLTVAGNGAFTGFGPLASCDVARPVACCALVP